jgi:hypothetical protein
MTKYNIKIAFLISGMTRNYIYCSHSFKKYIFDNCDGDIFISFKKNTRIYYSENTKIEDKYKIFIDDKIDDYKFLKVLFKDKLKYFDYDDEEYIEKLKTEKMSTINDNLKSEIGIFDQYARVRNIAEKFELYKNTNNTHYDVVIRLRLDRIWWLNDIKIEDYIFDKSKIYISYIDRHKSKYNEFTEWAQDFFIMGNVDLMIYIMKNFFENIYKSYEFTLEHKLNKSPEIQFANYINSNKLLENKIVNSTIRFTLCALYCDRPLYLTGYLVGTYKNVYRTFLENCRNEYINKNKNLKNKNIINKNLKNRNFQNKKIFMKIL